MKTLALTSMLVAALAFIVGLLCRFKVIALLGLTTAGLMRIVVIALLFGINFGLLSLLQKK